jgi:hypothetical protein
MGIVIAFPAEKCTAASGLIAAPEDILPVIRIERQEEDPTGLEPTSSTPRGKRRKR